jgi:hypothetical protein
MFFEGAKPFLIHLGSKFMYLPVQPYVLNYFCFILFYYYYVPRPSHRSFADPYGVINDVEKTPRKFQFGKKSATVYHCLYSLLMQLQVAL